MPSYGNSSSFSQGPEWELGQVLGREAESQLLLEIAADSIVQSTVVLHGAAGGGKSSLSDLQSTLAGKGMVAGIRKIRAAASDGRALFSVSRGNEYDPGRVNHSERRGGKHSDETDGSIPAIAGRRRGNHACYFP